MPLHPDCEPGHVLSFAVIGQTANELEFKAKLMANDYFGELVYEMNITSISACTYVDINEVVHGYSALVSAGIVYQDKDTKAQKEARTNPFSVMVPLRSHVQHEDGEDQEGPNPGQYI